MDQSYAEITAPNSKKTVVNDWPDLKNQHKNKIKRKGTDTSTSIISEELNPELNTLTNAMERLSTEYEVGQSDKETGPQKSKDEIRAERQVRRRTKNKEKSEKRFQEKLEKIREPKSQKFQVVDQIVMETYLSNRKESPISNRRQIKSKNHSAFKIDLLDLINTKVVQPIDRSSILQSKKTIKFKSGTQCHKGKKREVLKRKYVSKLKRSILGSRLLRSKLKTEVKVVANDEVIDVEAPQCSDNELFKPTTLSAIEPSGVKFSRKFRPYCDNQTSPELLSLTEALLRDVFRFQDRAYNKNEVKARSQKRYVVGFKEAMRQLDIGKVKLLIIAPDLEQSSEAGGISETIDEMKMKCKKYQIPYVFSLKRRQLGYVLFKKVPVSCVGVLNYQGSEENSQKLLLLIQAEKIRFQSEIAIGSENK